jgi:DNA-binding protein Fis
VDRLLLPRVLEHTRGNLQQAALLLGIARQTLRLKLRDLGLSVPRQGEAEDGC